MVLLCLNVTVILVLLILVFEAISMRTLGMLSHSIKNRRSLLLRSIPGQHSRQDECESNASPVCHVRKTHYCRMRRQHPFAQLSMQSRSQRCLCLSLSLGSNVIRCFEMCNINWATIFGLLQKLFVKASLPHAQHFICTAVKQTAVNTKATECTHGSATHMLSREVWQVINES